MGIATVTMGISMGIHVPCGLSAAAPDNWPSPPRWYPGTAAPRPAAYRRPARRSIQLVRKLRLPWLGSGWEDLANPPQRSNSCGEPSGADGQQSDLLYLLFGHPELKGFACVGPHCPLGKGAHGDTELGQSLGSVVQRARVGHTSRQLVLGRCDLGVVVTECPVDLGQMVIHRDCLQGRWLVSDGSLGDGRLPWAPLREHPMTFQGDRLDALASRIIELPVFVGRSRGSVAGFAALVSVRSSSWCQPAARARSGRSSATSARTRASSSSRMASTPSGEARAGSPTIQSS